MIIGKTFFKRDAFLHARVPEEIKQAFQALAKSKGKTASEYVLELVLNELEREEVNLQSSVGDKQNLKNHEK
ncbi:ribbon-helix-helix domain-containing protein [Flavilitoribacter nigricans]|uniref:Uncharacterized protein n=1 Tax=Flavilitoribacter nigricans (strain ATCC 23147 / DSM 23189 / NBRC 102662 / NCIMB 1420 / SS-2) TaxID=1122177 RepID=A0A2D0MYH2_FLAN2|nr:hypothetical protein [Flavilitoribacter nigricans]PHN00929.1 hypothetical protein CRP01_39735 [Flavilitoribacter nigricans DSM 23189 = NBRC 102662]